MVGRPYFSELPLGKGLGHVFDLVMFDTIFLGLCWVFVSARGLSLVAKRGGSSLRCMGFSLRWLLLLQSTGSRFAGFSSCGTWAQ